MQTVERHVRSHHDAPPDWRLGPFECELELIERHAAALDFLLQGLSLSRTSLSGVCAGVFNDRHEEELRAAFPRASRGARMLPGCAVCPVQKIRGFELTNDPTVLRVENHGPADFHREVREDAACG